MAKTVITSTTNSIKVVFNDDSTLVGMDKGTWVKANIDAFHLNSDHIEVIADNGARWIVSNATNSINALAVDTVDGAAPTSLSDLYDKLVALIA